MLNSINYNNDIFYNSNLFLPYIRLQTIQANNISCNLNGRPGFSEYFENKTCTSTFYSNNFNKSAIYYNNTPGEVITNYTTKVAHPESKGYLVTVPNEGYYIDTFMNSTSNDTYWSDFV